MHLLYCFPCNWSGHITLSLLFLAMFLMLWVTFSPHLSNYIDEHHVCITSNKDETMQNKTQAIKNSDSSLKLWLCCHKRFHCLGPYPVVLNYVILYTLPAVKYNHFKHLIRNHCDNPVCTARGRLQVLEAGLWNSAEDSAESQSLLRFEL